jgi:predicted metal-binding membrane protein
VAAAYLLVWASSGALIFAIGIALADVEMRLPAVARVVPTLVSLVLLIAGALQLSRWKERRLACCRRSSGCPANGADAGTAWRHGFDLGLKCCACCAPLTAMLLVVGVMDLGAMAAASVAIALERLVPRGRRIARASGILLFAAGLTMLAGT